MTDQQIEVYDKCSDMSSIQTLGESIALSGMFGCDNKHQGNILALQCMTERKPPMELKKNYHLIYGQLTKRADAILSDFKKSGGAYKIVKRDADGVAIHLTEPDGQEHDFSLTWEEAKQEPFPYQGKESYIVPALQSGKIEKLELKSKYATPRSRMQMLWARLVSDSIRAIAPEIVVGSYTPEEVSDFAEPKPSTAGASRKPPMKQAEKVADMSRAEDVTPMKQAETVAPSTPSPSITTPPTGPSEQDYATEQIDGDHPRDRLKKWFNPHDAEINAFLVKQGRIKDGESWRDAPLDYLQRVEKDRDSFLKAVGVGK